MKNPLKSRFTRSLVKGIVRQLCYLTGSDPLDIAYSSMGVGNWVNLDISGERYLIEHVLPRLVNSSAPVFFDVGANEGDFTTALCSHFPTAHVYAFEPHPAIFARCEEAVSSDRVKVKQIALGATSEMATLYDYSEKSGTCHATLHQCVMTDLHASTNLVGCEVVVTTLDKFCDQSGVESIDFLKIDTEGHELAVLQGAGRLLESRAVPVLQFEFNEMNVISRVFLKDFYESLHEYTFFRISRTGLVPLGEYRSRNEIFQIQNILAVGTWVHIPRECIAS